MSRAFNHVAISVTDIRMAMLWYRDVLGMTVLREPAEISAKSSKSEDSNLGPIVTSIFGSRLGKFLICHLSSANGVGLELFEFIEPQVVRREDNFEYWKTGFYHVAITEARIEELAEKIASTGGKKRTDVMEVAPGKKICFCEDPFGNVLEIYSHSYEQFWSNVRM